MLKLSRTLAVPALLLLQTELCTAAAPHMVKLPYPGRPLVQEGSGNLLPSPGFADGLEGWNTWGDVEVVHVDGEPVLRFGPHRGKANARIRVYLPEPKGGTLYLLRFEVKLPPDPAFDGSLNPSGLNGWLSHAAKGENPMGSLKVREARHTEEWLPREFRLLSQPDTDAVYVLLAYSGATGCALTRRWSLCEERVPASDGRTVLETPSGHWAEMPKPPVSPPPPRPLLFAFRDPDAMSRHAVPDAGQPSRPLHLAGTPGEMCVAAVGLRSPAGLPGASLSLSSLSSADGLTLSAEALRKRVVFHPRRTDYYGRGMTFHTVPDFLLDIAPGGLDCPAGETTCLWLNLRIPHDAKPGVYSGSLRVTGADPPLTLPFRVRVHPFARTELRHTTRHMYLDNSRWREMTAEQVVAELLDVKDHGYESITLSCSADLDVQGQGFVGVQLADESLRGVRLALRAGLRGPFLFWGGWLVRQLPARLGIAPDILKAKADTWPERLATAAVAALREIKAQLAELGVPDPVLVLVDEPGYWKEGSPERMLWDVRVAGSAGWKTYCTSSLVPSDPIGQGLDFHCYGGDKLTSDPRQAAYVAAETKAAGQELWYYCTGAYTGQIGNMVRNRYLAGFMFFRCKATGTASWTFQRPKGNAFDDFLVDERTGTPRRGQACITYPNPVAPGTNLDTLQWEGLRQALYDHQYAETLRERITAARPQAPEAAAAAQERLNALMAELPWNGNAFLWPDLSNAKLSNVRSQLAEAIIRLTPHVPDGATGAGRP